MPDFTYTWKAKFVKRTTNPRVFIYYANMRITVSSRQVPIEINSSENIFLTIKELEEMSQAVKEAWEIMEPLANIKDILE